MAVKVGINGFGRIGRNLFRAAHEAAADLEVVAVNDITDAATLAHLLKYDSILGRYPGEVSAGEGSLTVDGTEIGVLAERDPAELPWGELGVEVSEDDAARADRTEQTDPSPVASSPWGRWGFRERCAASRRPMPGSPRRRAWASPRRFYPLRMMGRTMG
jgi:hypothetical protein